MWSLPLLIAAVDLLGDVLGKATRQTNERLRHEHAGETTRRSASSCSETDEVGCDRCRVRSDLMLPDDDDFPTVDAQLGLNPSVPLDIRFELSRPEFCVSLRSWWVALGTCVPEAPVHQHRQALSREDDVRAPRQRGLNAIAASARRPEGCPEPAL